LDCIIAPSHAKSALFGSHIKFVGTFALRQPNRTVAILELEKEFPNALGRINFRVEIENCLFGISNSKNEFVGRIFDFFKIREFFMAMDKMQPTEGKMTILSSDNGLLNGDVTFFFGLHSDCNKLAFDKVFLGIAEVVLRFFGFLDNDCQMTNHHFEKHA
jgi:hypothetical protein